MRSMENIKRGAQTIIEYGLILALVAVVSLVIINKFGGSMTKTGDMVGGSVNPTGASGASRYCIDIGKTYNSGTCK